MSFLDELPHVSTLVAAPVPLFPEVPADPAPEGLLGLLESGRVSAFCGWLVQAVDDAESVLFDSNGGIVSEVECSSLRHRLNQTMYGQALHIQRVVNDLLVERDEPLPPADYRRFVWWDALPSAGAGVVDVASLYVAPSWRGHAGAGESATDNPVVELLRVRRLAAADDDGSHAARKARKAAREAEKPLVSLAAAWYGSNVLGPLEAARALVIDVLALRSP